MLGEIGTQGITAEQAAWMAPAPVGEMQPGTTIIQSMPSDGPSVFFPDAMNMLPDDTGLIRERLIRESPIGGLLSEILYSSDDETFQTGRHEVMHGLINPSNVIAMSVVPEGDSLGRTFLRYVDDATAAAGIVHGEGYGGDWTTIALRALRERRSVRDAVSSAVGDAQAVLEGYPDDVIDLVACGLMKKKNISGAEFRQLVRQAYREIGVQEKEDASAAEQNQSSQRVIQIDVHVSGLTYSFYENGDKVKVVNVSICSDCGGENGAHAPQCRTLTEQNAAKDENPLVGEESDGNDTRVKAEADDNTKGNSTAIFDGNDPAKNRSGRVWIMPIKQEKALEDVSTEIEKPFPLAA